MRILCLEQTFQKSWVTYFHVKRNKFLRIFQAKIIKNHGIIGIGQNRSLRTIKKLLVIQDRCFSILFWIKIEQSYSFQEAFSYANETYMRWITISPKSRDTVEIQNSQMIAIERNFFDEFLRLLR